MCIEFIHEPNFTETRVSRGYPLKFLKNPYPEIEESLNGEKRHVIIFTSVGIPGFQRFSQKVIRKTEKRLAAGEFFRSIDPREE